MNPQTILIYDGSFDGFLSCIFLIYDQKIIDPTIRKASQTNNQMFTLTEEVITEEHKARRVWKGFKEKTNAAQQRDFFKVFLSEIKGVENTLLKYMKHIFAKRYSLSTDFSNKDVLKINQVAQMVQREKHRMEAFIRFRLTNDDLYVATVTPDFNVLPLIAHHFKDYYTNHKWLLFDTTRKYGIYYDLVSVEIITFDNINTLFSKKNKESGLQELWNTNYKSANITSRKNIKPHLQHLPKQYWKYLIEKSNDS